MSTLVCYLNPASGRAHETRRLLEAQEEIDLRIMDSRTMQNDLRAELRKGVRRLAVAGGDGTVATAAAEIAGGDTELAIIPAGTLNHFARNHGIPLDTREAASVAAGGQVKSVDVGLVNERLFLNTCSVGAYWSYVQLRDRKRDRFGYLLSSVAAGVQTLAQLPFYSLTIERGGLHARYRTPLLFVGVGERDLRFPVSGERKPSGKRGLHAIVVRSQTRRSLLRSTTSALISGIPGDRSRLDSFVTDEFEVQLSSNKGRLAVDGEAVRMKSPLRFSYRRNALKVVVPDE